MPSLACEEKAQASSSGHNSRLLGAIGGPAVTRASEDEELPAYAAPFPRPSNRRERVEHSFYLRGSGRPWLRLALRSRAAKQEQMPYMLGGEPVTGYVELTLEKPEYFLAIEVSITGQTNADVTPERRDPWTFLALSKTVWKASEDGDKKTLMSRLRQRNGEKLSGTCRFDFAFDLPQSISYESGFAEHQHDFPLPASFTEQGAMCSVTYEITVQVRRGVLSTDVGFAKDIAYCPAIRPNRFSALRRAASEQGISRILGPDQDPEGWSSVGSTTIAGEIFGDRHIEVSCTLWLANPLCYTRGAVIPCVLTFASSDSQALDLLSSPSVPDLKLLGHLTYRPARQQNWKSEDRGRLKGKTTARGILDTFPTKTRVMQSAVWWTPPREDGEQREDGKRTLFGEIHLSPKLKPMLVVPDFKLYYTVALMNFRATGFAPAPSTSTAVSNAEDEKPLLSYEVEIATLHAKGRGAIAHAVTPPSYEQPGKWPNTAMETFTYTTSGYN